MGQPVSLDTPKPLHSQRSYKKMCGPGTLTNPEWSAALKPLHMSRSKMRFKSQRTKG